MPKRNRGTAEVLLPSRLPVLTYVGCFLEMGETKSVIFWHNAILGMTMYGVCCMHLFSLLSYGLDLMPYLAAAFQYNQKTGCQMYSDCFEPAMPVLIESLT